MNYFIFGLIMIMVILIVYGILANFYFVTTKYTINNEKLYKILKDKKVVIIADLHNNIYGKDNKRLLKKIDDISPAYIIMAGDVINHNSKDHNENAKRFVTYLSKKYTVIYTDGNHEQGFFADTEKIFGEEAFKNFFIESNNLIHLVNNYVQKENVRVYGLRIARNYFKRTKRPAMNNEYLTKLLGKADKNCYNILVAHNPLYFEDYAEWGADLVISGHVHGGFARIPFIGGVISPQLKIFPKYSGGIYKYRHSTLILSRGLGMHTIKFRVFNEPELVVLSVTNKIKPANTDRS